MQLLKSLGYDGMEIKGIDGFAETLAALDQQGLLLYTVYLNINLDDPEQAYDQRLEAVFKLLKGRLTMPWFYTISKKHPPSSEENDRMVEKAMPFFHQSQRS